MSAYNNQQPRQMFNSYSTLFYPKHPHTPPSPLPFPTNNPTHNR